MLDNLALDSLFGRCILTSIAYAAGRDRMKPEKLSTTEIEIDEVRPEAHGFTLVGISADRTPYRLELVLDFPMDLRTRRVLGEFLSQAVVRVSQLPRERLKPAVRATRHPSVPT